MSIASKIFPQIHKLQNLSSMTPTLAYTTTHTCVNLGQVPSYINFVLPLKVLLVKANSTSSKSLLFAMVIKH